VAGLSACSRRLPETTPDVTIAQGLEGSRLTRWQLYRYAASGSRERPLMSSLPITNRPEPLLCANSNVYQDKLFIDP
jgi:hypothetical protein